MSGNLDTWVGMRREPISVVFLLPSEVNDLNHSVAHVTHIFVSLSVTHGSSMIFSRYSVSSTYKTDHHDITEIFLKVAFSTITLLLTHIFATKNVNKITFILEIHYL